MTTLEKCMSKYENQLKSKININIDRELLSAVVKGCGPSIYRTESSLVASSDSQELLRIKNNFLIKKLGLEDGEELEAGIRKVVDIMGKSNRVKYRAVFYYLLVRHFKAKRNIIKSADQNNFQNEEVLDKISEFGVSFLESQEDIDIEIRSATDDSFSDLLL